MEVEADFELPPKIPTEQTFCPFLFSMNSCPHKVLFALAQLSPSFVLSWHDYCIMGHLVFYEEEGKQMRL